MEDVLDEEGEERAGDTCERGESTEYVSEQ